MTGGFFMRHGSLSLAWVVLAACVVRAQHGAPSAIDTSSSDGGGTGGTTGTTTGSNPLPPAPPSITRGKTTTSSSGTTDVSAINTGGFSAPVSGHPWVGINVGAGPTKILVSWLADGQVDTGGVDSPDSAPGDYFIDTSPDGTNWTTMVTVTGNDTNAREHALDFTGMSWVRLRVDTTFPASATNVHIVLMEVFDISNGSEDTWVFIGDSITALTMNRFQTPDFMTLITQAKPAFTPMVIDEAIGGTTADYALGTKAGSDPNENIDVWIARFPDVRNFAVAYGSNDAGCDSTGAGVAAYIANMQALLDKLKAADKRVIIPHIPWRGCTPATAIPQYNAGLDTLQTTDSFVSGPDLYTYFAAHPEDFGADELHPVVGGGPAAMNTLWAAAAAKLYP
jgi:hypothetical protein